MPKGHYTGGSTVIGATSDWFGRRVHKSDTDSAPGPKPRNIFKPTAESRKAEQEFLEKLAEERREFGFEPKDVTKAATGPAKRNRKKFTKKKKR